MSSHAPGDIASQTTRGSLYSLAGSGVTITLGFLRAVVLARLLAPEDFGVVTLGLFFVALVAQIRTLGLDQAYIAHQNADQGTRRTYVTLRIGLTGLSSLILILITPLIGQFYPTMPLLSGVLIGLAILEIIKSVSTIQETELSKTLKFRQLALTNSAASIMMTLVAPTLAWLGWGAWALIAEQASGLITRAIMTGLIFRSWPARPGWTDTAARHFWQYGQAAWGASAFQFLLDRFDDFWIGTTLGQTALGYYSRAYDFAHYPRRMVAIPLISVFQPVFARLQNDHHRLSQAFYRAAYVILRSGFLTSGAFALVMPEFIHLVIGDQWQPMLFTFRLMLIYTMLDALIVLCATFLFAIGKPQQYQRTTLIQFVFFIPTVILGAYAGGINGVALAANGMLIVGCIVLYQAIRQTINFSLVQLTAWPTLALLLAWGSGLVLEIAWLTTPTWGTALIKLLLFTILYALVLLIFEWHETRRGIGWIWNMIYLPARK